MTVQNKTKNPILFCLLGAALLTQSAWSAEGDQNGNRYNLQRYYKADVSAASTYVKTVVQRPAEEMRIILNGWGFGDDAAMLVDVRGVDEHAAGHPEGSISIPYPRIWRGPCVDRYPDGNCKTQSSDTQTISQEPSELFWAVRAASGNNQDREIYTLCRTGFRSVLAGNILSRPELFLCDENDHNCRAFFEPLGFTNVHNIWQGFVGQPLVASMSSSVNGRSVLAVVGTDAVEVDDPETPWRTAPKFLDLDNDGEITLSDRDGWRWHQGLPYSTDEIPGLTYGPYAHCGNSESCQ